MNILATSESGGASGIVGAAFTVTYTDGTSTSFTQSVSDIQSPNSYSGETVVSTTSYLVQSDGSDGYSAAGWHIYGYTFPLNSAKTVSTFTVPSTRGVQLLGVSLYTSSSTGAAAPAGWTSISKNSNGSVSQNAYYRIAASADVAGSTTYAFTFPSNGLAAGSIVTLNGVAQSSPVGTVTSQANAASTSYTAPALSYVGTQSWVGLYTIANGATSGSDFNTPNSGYATTVADAGTGSGTSGVLIGSFYDDLEGCGSTCLSSTWVATSKAATSATSIGTSILINGGTPNATALWHFDETSWSGAAGEVIDASANGYNGVAQHSATTSGTSPALSGSPGTCYYGGFNGTNQYVKLPTSLPHVGRNTTITAWIRPTGTSAHGRIFDDDYNGDGYALSYGDPGSQLLRFYSRNPSVLILNSNTALALNTWYFVAIEFANSDSSITMFMFVFTASGGGYDGVANSMSTSTAWSAGTGPYATIGGNADTSSEGAGFDFPGSIDEVTIYDAALTYAQMQALAATTHPCGTSVPDHYAVATAGTAVNCDPATVTVTAHTATHTAIDTPDTITLSTSTGHGDWTLSSGAGTFTAGSSNSGAATYAYSQADAGVAVFKLRDTYAETVTINVADGGVNAKSGSALASEDAPLSFAPSGFRITDGSNAAATIGTQQSGLTSTQSLALQAVRTDTNTNACTSLFTSGTTANVSLAFQCNNPTSCRLGQTLTFTNNGTATSLAANASTGFTSYTSVPVKFTTANGEAPFTINYTDAGQITLGEKYSIPLGNGSSASNAIQGASQFVVQPYNLKLSNVKSTANGTINPGANTPTGTVFMAAGQALTTTVTATNYAGNATPNFGQETSPATVILTPALVVPSSGHDPSVSGSFGAFSGGSATGTAFSWPEVGIMTLTPSVASYLGSGPLAGQTSGNVGRFIPNGFAAVTNTPVFGTGCAAGGFTYLGQPITYTVAPVITVTPQAYGGTTTQNYTGSLWRLSDASLSNRTYTPTPATPTLIMTGLPSTSSDPVIVDGGSGGGTLTFGAGTGLSFSRGSVIVPFNANIALSINVIDLDGAAVTSLNGTAASNPVTFGASGGISFSTSAAQYYGRLALRNAIGSELLDLPMSLTTQYYASTAGGFTTNTADSCSAGPGIAFSAYQMNLTNGRSCVRDSGSPGVSGAGCAAAASGAYRAFALGGDFNLILAAPGSGFNGALDVTATAPSWLQYIWNSATATPTGPTGIATFGVFPGSPTRIYQREVY
jgi:MSHA biogenesis protein MshQ